MACKGAEIQSSVMPISNREVIEVYGDTWFFQMSTNRNKYLCKPCWSGDVIIYLVLYYVFSTQTCFRLFREVQDICIDMDAPIVIFFFFFCNEHKHVTWIQVKLHIQVWGTEMQQKQKPRQKLEGRKSEFNRKASGTEHRPDSDSSEKKNIRSRRRSSRQHVRTHTNKNRKAPYTPPPPVLQPISAAHIE